MSVILTGAAVLGALDIGKGILSSLPTAFAIYKSARMNVKAHERIAEKNIQYQRERDIRNEQFQRERDERLAELQERQRREDKYFQLARDERHERFQMELEAQRMSFQEHLELRRLQFQVKMEKRREEFQLALAERQIQNQRELAQYQAMAMRETQILVARESAQNMLGNQMVLEALKTFPLNISPLVLLNNRPHSLSSLQRFTIDDKLEIKDKNGKVIKQIEVKPKDMLADVMNYKEHPEALNIFIAPVFVDSRFAFQKSLSIRIWEATYQKIESFFTKYYSRDGQSPVLFYPTAWNDKYTSGVHASETLHYFLKDLPCIVLEPKFDGSKFRMAISFWGLGYASTEHHRTEWECDVNTDLSIANAAYNRSKNALEAIKTILSVSMTDTDQKNYHKLETVLKKNVNLYEAFKIGELGDMSEAETDALIKQLESIGIGNVFAIDFSQDLEPLADYFSSQIGATLAMLSDLHHLITTDATPILPKIMQKGDVFREVYANKGDREVLCDYYTSVYANIRNEECNLASSSDEASQIRKNRDNDIDRVRRDFNIDPPIPNGSWQEQVIEYMKRFHNFTDADFENVWSEFLKVKDGHIKEHILAQIPEEEEYYDQLDSRM